MSAPDLVAGQIVGGKFTIRRERARTELAVIYEAITAPSREVELMVMAPSLRQRADFDQRMQRTMRATNELPSSLALQVLDVGIDGDTGAPFVATELSVTPSLAELVQLCPLAVEEVICFARNLGTALDAAHSRGLPHLTLSPANVFVGPSPRFEVRIADFGASMLMGAAGSDPRWAAPELGAAPQTASDVFSAGLITLFAATGAALQDRSDAALRAPATTVARETGTAVDGRFDAPLARALAMDPAQRYRSVAELAEAIAQAFGVPSAVPALSSNAHLPAAPPPAVSSPHGAMAFVAASEPVPLAAATRTRLVLAGVGIAATLAVVVMIGWMLTRADGHVATASPASSGPAAAFSATVPPLAQGQAEGAPQAPIPSIAPAAATAPPSDAARTARLVVICTPECDLITVDRDAVTSFPTALAPGDHTVTVRRGAHPLQSKRVVLAADKEETVSFIFYATRTPPKKNCGKFLQRCD